MPDVAVGKVRRFCEAQNRHDLADKLRNDFDVRGRSITIVECRPPWDGSPGEWTRTPIAQIRYDAETGRYAVYWADRNDRWRRYEEIEPTVDIEVVLREIDEDPICVFWG